MNLEAILERHRHRIELLTGAAVLSFGWALGVMLALLVIVPWVVGIIQITKWLGRID